ncbi:hypothetical protein BGZ58_004491 [Dissophora ornata]|nr:hypothetical protein BGZ58_004491 [Dissophora ornata]
MSQAWDEYRAFELFKESKGGHKANVQLHAGARKQLNNRNRIIKVEFLVTQELEESEGGKSRELALRNAMERLDDVRVQYKWSINQLVKYCRQQNEGRRMSKGKAKAMAMANAKTKVKDDTGSAGVGENLAGATNDDYDGDDGGDDDDDA